MFKDFCGEFGYADDVAIVYPSLYGLKKTIIISEEYAKELYMLFNPEKSQLLCYNMLTNIKPVINLCGEVTEVIDSDLYLLL